MAKITYIEHTGQVHVVDVPVGNTVMQGGRDAGIAGIVAECGGACSCSTCHVYVHPGWVDRLLPKESMEEDMLDFAYDVRPTSRLSCQIRVTAEIDGLVLHTPEQQG